MAATLPIRATVGGREGTYHPGLDGLRAFAVVGAMLFHARVLSGGFLGVDLFFVLSGYLITGLLLTEGLGTRTISLVGFYTRRFRRLAPALALVLVGTLMWAYFAAPRALGPTAATQVGWSVAYLNNWYALFGHVGYWGTHATILPLSHLWSLAIEEQFYLVWPVLVLIMVRGAARLRHFLYLTVGLAVASAGWQWWVADHWGSNRAYLGTDSRFTALAIGATVAVLLKMSAERRTHPQGPSVERGGKKQGNRTEQEVWEALWRSMGKDWRPRPHAGSSQSVRAHRRWDIGVVGATVMLAVSWVTADLPKVSLFHGWLAGCSLAAAVIIAAVATKPTAWYSRFLSLKPFVWTGKRSYSLYLWHFPIWVIVNSTDLHTSSLELWAVRLTLTIVVSMASYSWLEEPIRRSSLSGFRMGFSLGPIAAVVAALVIINPPALPIALASSKVVLGARGAANHPIAFTAATDPGLKILVAGDSWARNMGYALSLADPAHRNTVIDLGVPGCGLDTPSAFGCQSQAQSWQNSEANDHPDVALLVEGISDQLVAQAAGGNGTACTPDYETQYRQALDAAIATLHGKTNLPVFVTNDRDSQTGDPQSASCVNQMIAAAAQRDSASFFDLQQVLCPAGTCVAKHDGGAVYDETGHLAPAGQKWIGGLILASIRIGVTPAATNTQPVPAGACQTNAGHIKAAPIASYTVQPLAPYLDSTTKPKLTDGAYGKPTYADPAWIGWRTTSIDIVEHLAGTEAVCTATSNWLQDFSAAVVLPTSVTAYVSNDPGQLGQKLGTADAPQISAVKQTASITAYGTQPVTGQYLTLRVSTVGDWAFTDEIGTSALTP